jgi:hypothetical protein
MTTRTTLKAGDRITWCQFGAGTITAPFVLDEADGQEICNSEEHEGISYPLWTVNVDQRGEKTSCWQHLMEKIDG